MTQEKLRKIIETTVRAGVRLGVNAVGETRSLGSRSTFTETHIKLDEINALVDSTVAKLEEVA
jgi:hypothetical protein